MKFMKATKIVHRVYLSFGLGINFKPGKSEAVFQLRGPGTRDLYTTIVNYNNSLLPFQADTVETPPDYDGLFLRVVKAYKHMGTSSVGLVCNNHEAKVRAAAMHDELRRSRSKIYHNKLLTRPVWFDFVESLLYSRLLFNYCILETDEQQAVGMHKRAYMSPLLSVCDKHNRSGGVHFFNLQVLVDAECITLADRLRITRLRYLKRFLHKARPQLLRMTIAELSDSKSWIGLVIEDLIWLVQHVCVLTFRISSQSQL